MSVRNILTIIRNLGYQKKNYLIKLSLEINYKIIVEGCANSTLVTTFLLGFVKYSAFVNEMKNIEKLRNSLLCWQLLHTTKNLIKRIHKCLEKMDDILKFVKLIILSTFKLVM